MSVEAPRPEAADFYGELCNDPASSHQALLRLVGTGKSVLDVGCGAGFLAAALEAQGNRCTGIENHEGRANAARAKGIPVLSWDLQQGLPPPSGGLFDCIIFADVLEHLPDPLAPLAASASRLSEGGRVIVSVPNVANYKVRTMLLRGRWVYQDEGIMDRTHVRWFTRKTLLELVGQAGLQAEAVHFVPDFPCIHLLAGRPGRTLALARLAARAATDILPEFFGLQIIVVASPAP